MIGEAGTQEVVSDEFPTLGIPVAALVDVRVGSHDGFDRIVLEFEGDQAPSYRVTYVDPPIREDGSGHEVDIDGRAFLELRLSPAGGVDLSGPEPVETYDGPDRFTPEGTAVLSELVRTGDFEANLAWVAGLQGRAPFAVGVLESPIRLVVDVVSA
jgi:hypothetical protein